MVLHLDTRRVVPEETECIYIDMVELTALRAVLAEFLGNTHEETVTGLSSVTVVEYVEVLDVDQYDRRGQNISVMDHGVKIRDQSVTCQKTGQGVSRRVLLYVLTHLVHRGKIEDRTDDNECLLAAVIYSLTTAGEPADLVVHAPYTEFDGESISLLIDQVSKCLDKTLSVILDDFFRHEVDDVTCVSEFHIRERILQVRRELDDTALHVRGKSDRLGTVDDQSLKRVRLLLIRDIEEDTDLIVFLVRRCKVEDTAGVHPDFTLDRRKDTEVQTESVLLLFIVLHDGYERGVVLRIYEVTDLLGRMLKIVRREIEKIRQ